MDDRVSRLLIELEDLNKSIPHDSLSRSQLSTAAKKLVSALETPLDMVRRISFAPLQLIVCKIAIDLRIFQLLSNESSPMSVSDLAMATKANEILLVRILRFLSAASLIAEYPNSTFAASKVTRDLSNPGFEAGLKHHFNAQLPAWLALPSFLASTSYVEPADAINTPFQKAHHTALSAFQWASARPELMREFALWMSAQRNGQKSWLDAFPLASLCEKADAQSDSLTPVFVDVGSGMGHQCLALRERLPDLKGRIVMQDLAAVLARVAPIEGVLQMTHDFWSESQPVYGAHNYYMRNVLHDYPDVACAMLLRNISGAMSATSTMLIDEIVLADANIPLQATEIDIGMMASLAGKERSEGEWRALLEETGLVVKDIIIYEMTLRHGIIVAMLS